MFRDRCFMFVQILSAIPLMFAAFPLETKCQNYQLDEIRHEFYLSTHDYKYAFPLIEKLNQISNPNPSEIAYRAATEALLAKSGWNIFKKIRYLRSSRSSFYKAIRLDSTDVEIRFLRLSVEHHIPKYLGFSQHLAEDKQMIMKHLHRFKEKELAQEIIDYIILFSIESKIYTKEEIDHLKKLFAQH